MLISIALFIALIAAAGAAVLSAWIRRHDAGGAATLWATACFYAMLTLLFYPVSCQPGVITPGVQIAVTCAGILAYTAFANRARRPLPQRN